MGKMLGQLWTALTTLFSALDVLAKAVLHLCEWSEATAASFKEEAEAERLAKANAAKQQLKAVK